MTIEARLADGRVLQFPDGTDPQVIQATVKKMVTESKPDVLKVAPEQTSKTPSFIDSVVGGVEGATQLGTSLIAEPIAGILGLADAVNPFAPEGAGAARVQQVKEFLTFKPKTEQGKLAAQPIDEALQPLVEKLEKVKNFLGDDAFEATGSPALAAIASTLPEALLESIGAGSARRAAKNTATKTAKDIAQQSAVDGLSSVEDATGIKKLTTDVLPPESRVGKFAQQQGELIAPSQRATQQTERINAIDKLLTQFDVADGARFESRIVEGVKSSIGLQKRAAGLDFERIVNQLDGLGDATITKTKKLASATLAKELKKGSLADGSLIAQMEDFINSPDTLKFSDIQSIRSTIGNNLQKAKALAPVTGSSDVGLLSQLYKQLSNDMGDFAQRADKELFKDWRLADKNFSDFATGSSKAGVKAIIKRGDATPEVVDQLLFSNKNSDIEFLVKNIDDAGLKASKQRLLQRVMEKATPDGEIFNPNKFATQLSKLRNNIGKVFNADERKAIEALRDALNQTRRAQDSAVVTATGQSVVPLVLFTNPLALAPGAVQAIIEKPITRNLLLRRKAAKTAIKRFNIDKQLQAEIDKAGLSGAATTGTLIPQDEGDK